MQHGGDYGSYYAPQYPPPVSNPNPNPNPVEFPPSNPIQQPYASAPPYSTDFPAYSSSAAPTPAPAPYASYSQKPEPAPPLPPSAPSYSQPQSQFPPQFPTFPTYSPSPYPPESTASPLYPHEQPSSVPYYPYDPSQQAVESYAPSVNPSSVPNPSPNPSSSFSPPYPTYDAPYRSSVARPDQEAPYLNDDPGMYGHGRSGFGQDFHEKNPYGGMRYDEFVPQNDGVGDGVYQYDGGRSEPYGARGTVPTRSPALFDDYGRSISIPSGGKDQGGSSGKIVRAVPKVETQQDVKHGVQKFRVKLLPEGGGQSTMDVLCQVSESSTFTFWSKSSVDFDPRRIRLQSNSYTTNTILDTVTAATVQCTKGRIALTADENAQQVRVCDRCMVYGLVHPLLSALLQNLVVSC
ncbi:hypothetical protein BHM03_00033650 [Ensete ventricosum]|nr:hypothetical protein BHM03_00033650 [Ensete ventricosum]